MFLCSIESLAVSAHSSMTQVFRRLVRLCRRCTQEFRLQRRRQEGGRPGFSSPLRLRRWALRRRRFPCSSPRIPHRPRVAVRYSCRQTVARAGRGSFPLSAGPRSKCVTRLDGGRWMGHFNDVLAFGLHYREGFAQGFRNTLRTIMNWVRRGPVKPGRCRVRVPW